MLQKFVKKPCATMEKGVIYNLFRVILIFATTTQTAVADENTALLAAAIDIQRVPEGDRPYIHYIYRTKSLQVLAWVCNFFNNEALPHRPIVLNEELVRIDCRWYSLDFQKTFEEFQFDPKYHLLLTKDTLKFLDVKIPKVKVTKKEEVLVDVEPYEKDGKKYTKKWVIKNVTKEIPFTESDVNVVPLVSEHIDAKAFNFLREQTQSEAPIVWDQYFIYRATSSIKDDGVFKTIYGGLYYDLAGIKSDGKEKSNDLNVFLENLGIGNVKGGVDSEKLFNNLPSDERIAVFRSEVTGKPRLAEVLRTLAARDGSSIVSITHDTKDKNFDIGQHAMMNLQKFRDDAREVIAEKADGLHRWALFNGKGALQLEVPFDVASDSTIPKPYTQRLQNPSSCIRCHGNERGWRILTNDVPRLLSSYVDITNDLNTVGNPFKRLAGQFGGDVERAKLPFARDSYARAILKTTGPWKESQKGQLDVVEIASKAFGDIYDGYWYHQVDAKQALEEMGILIPKDEKPEVALRKLLPPVNVIIDGVIPEDPRIAALFMGIKINRADFDLIYSFAKTRAMKTILAGPGKGLKPQELQLQ